jgi:hypothetical protein
VGGKGGRNKSIVATGALIIMHKCGVSKRKRAHKQFASVFSPKSARVIFLEVFHDFSWKPKCPFLFMLRPSTLAVTERKILASVVRPVPSFCFFCDTNRQNYQLGGLGGEEREREREREKNIYSATFLRGCCCSRPRRRRQRGHPEM